ncbi:UNVERIFIED_CONTAM: Protein PIN-LIKES 7 [Sesamum indicum]
MGFWSLLEISSMPILQVLIISVLGAFMATDYLKLLPPDARRSLNKRNDQWKQSATVWSQILGIFHQIVEELKAPPVLAAIIGLIFGGVTWLRNLIIGENAPLRVIDDSVKLLGDGTIPCITLILGGNLTQGLSKARLKSTTVVAVICVRYAILPAVGIGVVKLASHLGFLPSDPLYHFVLMLQFTVPPAMNIALALTGWSTVFMWILT